jgi:hypothetical protein
MWAVYYLTDYPYTGTRGYPPANKKALSASVSQTLRMWQIEKEIQIFE